MLNIPERFDREDIADNVTIYKSTKVRSTIRILAT